MTHDSSKWTGRTRKAILACADDVSMHWSIQLGPRAFCLVLGNGYANADQLYYSWGRRFHAPYTATDITIPKFKHPRR